MMTVKPIPAAKDTRTADSDSRTEVQRYAEEADEVLQDCFETFDWQMFEDWADGNLSE